jgi:Zn-dependent protease/predicted transcriptional regulator
MNSGALKVATIGGIAIKLHWSWLIIALLLTFGLAVGQFPALAPGESGAFYWIIAAIASLLFFLSVLLHELSHSFIARALGYNVREIILFIFGGVANIEQEPKKARDEFLIAAVGPLTSFLLAGIFYLLLQWVTPSVRRAGAGAAAIFEYLAYINFLLALFNIIPGFPLDGGRVLRSIIWGVNRDFGAATRIAGFIGQLVAYGFIGWGIFQIFYQSNLGGLWIAFIGWFLLNAAQESVRGVVLRETFRGVYVHNLMEPPPSTIRPNATLAHLLSSYILPYNVRAVPVADTDDKLVGIVTLSDIKEVPQDQWGIATVGDYMTGLDKLRVVTPNEGLDNALALLSENDFDQLPVVDMDGRLVAILTRARIIRWLQIRNDLKQSRA